jgi:tetratricopeptide (TPR) repeat protein
MKTKYILLGLIISSMFLSSCDDKMLDLQNPGANTSDSYYKNPAQFDAAVISVYSIAKGQGLLSLHYFWLNEFLTDDCSLGGGQCPVNFVNIIDGTYDYSTESITSVWNGWYRMIHRANVVIAKAPGVQGIDETVRKTRIAEVKFFRAWAYYELVINFGKVPLYTEYAKSLSDYNPRAEIADVYAQIYKDLAEAKVDLPDEANVDGGRVTKYAAAALMAKAYLQQGNYAKAKDEFEFIEQSEKFALSPNFNDNFAEEVSINNESIFQINFGGGDRYSFIWQVDGDETYAGYSLRHVYISPTGWRNMIPSNSLLAEFECTENGFVKTDPRLKYTVYFTGDEYQPGKILGDGQQNGNASVYNGTTIKTSWRKSTVTYIGDGGWFSSKINQRVTRYSEVLLGLAECENELGNIDPAIAYLNLVRDRASVTMPHYPIVGKFPCTTKQEVFNAIKHERRVELAFEEVRANDLMRWKRLGKITTFPFLYTPKNPDGYLPIPVGEINSNDKIGLANQNQGF